MDKHSEPAVSVILCSYNGEAFLRTQIESVLAQSYRNWQLFIYDDCSSDNTSDIIREYAVKEKRIHAFFNHENIGYVKNFEQGIAAAVTPYIALCDQDDIWHAEKLEQQISAIKEAEKILGDIPLLIHSDLRMVAVSGRTLSNSYFQYRGYRLKSTKDLGHILGPCGVMGNTLLFNRTLQEKVLPFPQELKNHDYWIALVAEVLGKRITLNEPLVDYRIHTKNTSNSAVVLSWESSYSEILRRFFNRELKLPYCEDDRYKVLHYLKNAYVLKNEDRECIEKFMGYLQKKGSVWQRIGDMIECDFIKRDRWHRLRTIVKMIVNG